MLTALLTVSLRRAIRKGIPLLLRVMPAPEPDVKGGKFISFIDHLKSEIVEGA